MKTNDRARRNGGNATLVFLIFGLTVTPSQSASLLLVTTLFLN
jgi:hypothetical protein